MAPVTETPAKASWLAVLLSYAGRCRGKMAVSLLCSVASVAAGLVPFYAVYRIIDEVIAPAPDGGAVLAWVGAAAAGYVASKVLFGASTLLSHVSAYTILESLRDDVVEKLMKTSLGTAASKSIGQIKNVFVDRIEGVEVPLAHMIPELSGNVLLAAAIAVWMALIDWRIALACLVTVPIGLVVFASGLGAYNRMYAAYMAEGNHVNSVMVEYVEGIQVIKAFNQGSNSYQKYANAVRSFKDFTLGWFKATWVSMNLAFSILPTTLLGVLPVGLALYLAGDVTPAELGLEFVLALAVVAPLMKLSSFLNEAKAMEYAVADASEFLDLPELPEPAQRAAVRDEGVELANVSFSYESGEEVLHDVSLRVPRGSFCALVGPSGSGKSTLARLIARHWDVGAGAVRVGGVDVRDYDLEALRTNVAMVLQKNVLFSGTIAENLRWGDENATDDEVREAAHLACADEFVDGFPEGYDTYIEQGGSNVSGGQKQRLCIARALLRHPKVLILDDSTSAVDTKTDAKIRAGLATYLPQTTKIIIAQRISSVQDADRIVVMEGGRISDVGTHDELMRRSAIYRETYTSQNKMGTDESDVEAEEAAQDEAATAANAGAEKGGEADE